MRLTDDLISLTQLENKVSCKINQSVNDGLKIVAYHLLSDKFEKIEVVFSNKLMHTFTVRKNGLYKVRIFYLDKSGGKLDLIVNHEIDIDLVIPSIESIIDGVVLYRNVNKITCDLSNVKDLFSKFISCNVQSNANNAISVNVINDQAIFFIHDSGNYTLTFTIEDYNSQVNEFIINKNYELVDQSSNAQNVLGSSDSRLSLIYNIIYAFVIREFQRKYDKGYFRYFSIILGPAVQLGIMVLIFSLMGMKAVLGLSIPLFVLTGLIPYNLFTTSGNCLTIVQSNRALLTYKQVKIIDTIFASMLMEFLLSLVIFFSGLLICKYVGLQFTIYNPLSLLLAFFMLFLLTLGVAMILSVVGFYFAEFNYAIQVIFRALFYVSGVFFSIENVPVQYQKYFLWNPLFQLIEFIRFSLISFKLPTELSYLYVIKSALFCFMLGAMLYFVNRHKFMVNDRARI